LLLTDSFLQVGEFLSFFKALLESIVKHSHAAAPSEPLPPPLKIVGLTKTPDVHAAEARELLGGRGIHVIAAEMHIEFVNEGVNKASGLGPLCKMLGVPLSSAIAFGDAMNDVEMLTAVGLGVAMKNARAEVKQAADETCAWANDEDGVARKCEQLITEGRL